ncbi:hypothetical protein ASPVEDRAFT_614219 [Aspergillus versicolor CBS 583.65]|uniref:Uncharacterized protein n=1 Tax=Aspergillus versicolor CBS 583.65 TaxID=1036611 RepID=A0A1L9PHV0_ASPVE|nr:uncharacterized protein ASPVEDRAFT_614219 [Aspergillus versicolor CBS 583.65]OJJ01078.1 hypothetical protein ASPVEDRAFT_614219 [Aspergillus versicolor CBS 583.65]
MRLVRLLFAGVSSKKKKMCIGHRSWLACSSCLQPTACGGLRRPTGDSSASAVRWPCKSCASPLRSTLVSLVPETWVLLAQLISLHRKRWSCTGTKSAFWSSLCYVTGCNGPSWRCWRIASI